MCRMLNEIDDGALTVRRGDFITQMVHYLQYISFAKGAENVSDAK